ncbi:MAG: efflux RND transporter periplasmic adaptor subunit [Gammaproteobacteria bacterium]|nr:efflux RND transporter periplasmic adaptor subunit [Gammaproteobacteria bacterium]
MNSKSLGILIIAALVVAAAGGYWLGTTKSTPDGDTGISTSGPRQPLFYRNPMNPEVTSPVPAKDAMGMDYIPVYAADDEGAGRAGTVQIDPVTVQNIGVRTAEAERRSIGRTIQTVGRVDYDEQRLVQLHPKTEGWVEKLYVDTTGSPVKKDAMLLSLYSPQLVSTQQEYVLALRNLETLRASPFEDVRRGAEELVETTLERLRLLDVPDHQIADLTNTLEVKKQLHIHSPANGIVINIGAREGQYVTPPTELYAIADLSKVWVYVDIYEDELPWIRVGDQATIKVRAVPGQTFRGRLSYIYPYAESKTRTIKVRMEFDNADLLLKPNMFADVTIDASAIPDVIVVPSEAIIRSGAREQVFIRRAPGKFEPREVVLGVSSQGWTQIREGVAPGEEVVVSAQFLIDSESKLREAAAKMQEVNHD